jgi:hypothetical protein
VYGGITWGALNKGYCLGCTHRDPEGIGSEFSFLDMGFFKSFPNDSNVQLWLKITALINKIIMNCLITKMTTQAK